MEVLYPKCAGLDIHKDSVVACASLAIDGNKATQDVRSFATTTSALFELSAWLEHHGCTHVVMEATGVYWKPVVSSWRRSGAPRTSRSRSSRRARGT